MNVYEHIIIGGGISGCYIALQLLEQGITNFIMLEASGRFRGKQKSIRIYPDRDQEDPTILEFGSSIFHTQQSNLLGLLHYLNLSKDIRLCDPSTKACYISKNMNLKDTKERYKSLRKTLLELAFQNGLENNGQHPTITIEELAKNNMDIEDFELLKGCWPEWYENNQMNAYDYVIQDKSAGSYAVLNNGLEQILDASADILEESFIKWYSPVWNITYEKNKYIIDVIGQKSQYIAKQLYLCSNLKSIENINLNNLPNVEHYLSLGQYKPTMRYYAILDKDIDVPYEIISGDPSSKWRAKYTIQITPRVWLLSYVDSELVAAMIAKRNHNKLLEEWIEDMNHYFNCNLSLANIIDTKTEVWNDAFSILTPKWYSSSIEQTNPIQDNVMITCLPTQFNQAWMEGHLHIIPSLLSKEENLFVNILKEYPIDLPSAIIKASSIVPIVKQGEEYFIITGQERYGKNKDLLNIIGGKSYDKFWPTFENAIRTMFIELYEEACIMIPPEEFGKGLIRLFCKPDNDKGYNLVSIIYIDNYDEFKNIFDQEKENRINITGLPSKYKELQDLQLININLYDSTKVTSLTEEMIILIKEMIPFDLSSIQPIKTFIPVKINDLLLPCIYKN
jgi:hypothetical protein